MHKREKIKKQDGELQMDKISGYVTCVYNDKCWLAFVLDKDVENSEVTVTFLHLFWIKMLRTQR